MPELPEVETIKNVLKPILVNTTITSVEVKRKSTVVGNEKTFVSTLINHTFLDITRIGKYLIFHLNDNVVLISHLRMEGKYYELNEEENDSSYARVIFHLNNKKKVCYDDSRCFGIMLISNEKEYLKTKEIAKLGPEPFDIKDINYLIERTKNKQLPIKTTLLDQTLMCGLGNIYVDETLFKSQIHPTTPACLVTKEEWEKIVKNAQDILKKAIVSGGSTIKSYHPGKGINGNFQNELLIYGKKGQTCPICHKTYRFIKVNGRGTTFCPGCQHKKDRQLLVGITGKIASGKSTALAIFKKHHYPVISADDIVDSLYHKQAVISQIEKNIGVSFIDHKMDKNVLRDYLLKNHTAKRKLENIIHPLVKQEIISFCQKSSSPLVIVEVPLLFDAHFESLFDYIIGIDISLELQNQRLIKRNGESAIKMLAINHNNVFDLHKNEVDFLISNNGNIKEFSQNVEEIIDRLEEFLN